MKTVKVICPCSAHIGTHHYPDKPTEFVEAVGCCAECVASKGDYSKSSNWKEVPPPDIRKSDKIEHWMEEPEPDKRGHGKRRR